MATVYYRAFDLIIIDTDGGRHVFPSESINAYNVTASSSLGTLSSDSNGQIAAGSFTATLGDIVEFSHSTYPGTMRLKLRATSEEAFTDPEYPSTVFVLDDPRTAVTTSKTVQLYLADTAQPTVRPMYVGNAKAGGVTKIPYKSPLAQTVRVYAVSEDEEGQLSTLDVTRAEYDDIAVPPLTGTFLSLTDTPSSYTSQALKAVRVNASETALEFYTPSSGITIGSTAISSGTNGAILFQGSGTVQQDAARLFWDDSADRLGVNTNSPSANVHVKAKNNSDDVMFVDGTASQSGYLFRAGKNGNGNYFRIDSDGNIDAIGGVNTRIRGSSGKVYFPDGIILTFWESNGGSGEIRADNYGYPFQINALADVRALTVKAHSSQTVNVFEVDDSSFNPKVFVDASFRLGIGTSSNSAKIHVIATSNLFRAGYDTSNYVNLEVSSSGVVTFDAVGSGAKFVFSDAVEINGSLTLSAQNIVTDTTTGMKIGTGTTQKLGFFNATPVTQRTNIGAITDSTGGTPGTSVDDVGSSFDQSTLNDNFATLVQKMNAVEQVLQDLGLTS